MFSGPTGALTGGTCPHSHRTFQSEGTGGARCSVVLGRLAMQAFAVKRMRSLKPAREQLLQQRYPPLPLLLRLFHSRCRKLRPPSPTRTVPSEKFSFYLDFYKLGRMYCFTPADAKPMAQRPNSGAHRRHRLHSHPTRQSERIGGVRYSAGLDCWRYGVRTQAFAPEKHVSDNPLSHAYSKRTVP